MEQLEFLEGDTAEYQVLLSSAQGTETIFRTEDLWDAFAFYWKNKDNHLPYGLHVDLWINSVDGRVVKDTTYDPRYDIIDWFLGECGMFSQENR